MDKPNLTSEQFEKLVNAIFPILVEKGPSHTTMDYVASRLSMSKRTLYEIFGSKDNMMRDVLDHMHAVHTRNIQQILLKTHNMMESMALIIDYQQHAMSDINVAFFIDMDERYSHLRSHYDVKARSWIDNMEKILHMGAKQGVFRDNLNSKLQIRLLRVQMESLKRMEDLFPPEITLSEAFHAIGEGFLRSIATEEGVRILEQLHRRQSADGSSVSAADNTQSANQI